MDSAFKKVIGLVGIKSTQLLRRVPPNGKQLKPLVAASNVLNNAKIGLVSLSDASFPEDLAVHIVQSQGELVAADSAKKLDGIVCDSRGLKSTADLSRIHTKLQPLMAKLNKNGRVVMVGGDSNRDRNPVLSAVVAGTGGFTRALAKEVAARGSTANMIEASSALSAQQNNAAMGSLLSFLLSSRAAFVNGQTVNITPNATLTRDTNADTTTAAQGTKSAFSVSGKKVVLTGASRGIGEYTARLFHAEGAELLLVDHPSMSDRLQALSKELGCAYIVLDVTAPDAAIVLKNGIESAYGAAAIDVMIHNAGITKDKTFKNMPGSSFENVINVNLASICRMDDMLLTEGVLQTGGRLVYLSSISGVAGAFGQTNYSASKAGVMGYVASLGSTLAERGIAANAVAPGFIETEMTQAIPFFTRNVARHMNSLLQGGHPSDVAEMILFLSSPAAAGVTGSTIRVCGGHMVGK